MQILADIGIVILTIALMELLSRAMHKYLFHGPLWFMNKHIISKSMAG